MRILAYLVSTVGMLLVLATLMLTNSLASDGSHLQGLTGLLSSHQQLVDELRLELMRSQSLSGVSEAAKELGFSQPIRVITPAVHSGPLAQSDNESAP